MAIEIVDIYPLKMVIFNSYVSLPIISHDSPLLTTIYSPVILILTIGMMWIFEASIPTGPEAINSEYLVDTIAQAEPRSCRGGSRPRPKASIGGPHLGPPFVPIKMLV
jgi:hypothetical protein